MNDTAPALSTYRPSHKFEAGGVARMLSIVIPAGLGIGALYGVIAWYIPLVYLTCLALAGAAFFIGVVVIKASQDANNRNPPLAFLAGAVAGLAALYAAWVLWIAALSGWQAWFFNPVDLFGIATELLEDGVWSIGSSGQPVTGVFLATVWIIEALTLVAAPAVLAYLSTRNTPYIESIGQWATEKATYLPLAHYDKPARTALASRLAAGEAEALAELRPADDPEAGYSQATFNYSDADDSQQFLTLETVTPPKKKDQRPKTDLICRNLLIDRDGRQAIERVLADHNVDEAPAPDPQAHSATPAAEADPDRPSV